MVLAVLFLSFILYCAHNLDRSVTIAQRVAPDPALEICFAMTDMPREPRFHIFDDSLAELHGWDASASVGSFAERADRFQQDVRRTTIICTSQTRPGSDRSSIRRAELHRPVNTTNQEASVSEQYYGIHILP